MRDISEKVSYLQGLSEGLNISDGNPQGKIISGILGVLDDVSGILVDMRSEFNIVKDYIESIDDDLFELEENFKQNTDVIELRCDNCGEELCFDADLIEDDDVIEIICPRCNEVVFINDGSFDYEYSDYDDAIGDEHDNGMNVDS
ncbi:MAG TPA: AraC family transcriptional regulator [Syntrophomonas sp.]|nr:AraC family transcriptional regulator [Syntrophomonas sp.]